MNEVYQIFLEFSKNNKIFDKESILKIINIIKERYELNNYLLEINIQDKNPYHELGLSSANYDMYNYDLNIYMLDLQEYIKNKFYSYGLIFTEEEYPYFKNIIILYVLFHELEHVIQVKLMKESNNTTSNILRMTEDIGIYEDSFIENLYKSGLKEKEIKEFYNKRQILYAQNYRDCPMERFADINACIKLKYIVDLNGNLLNIKDFLQTMIYYYMIRSYSDKPSPTISYLNNTGNSRKLKEFTWYNENNEICFENCEKQFSLNDRICFGFPISREEYSFITTIMDTNDVLRKVR